ncbi:MAG: MBL fold metallo-hydrolase [Clostridia bacterium]
MKFKCIKTGEIMANCYILGCETTGEAIIIDPGFGSEEIERFIAEEELKPICLLNTHGHVDHMVANEYYKDKYKIPLTIHQGDEDFLTDPAKNLSIHFGEGVVSPPADHFLQDGDEMKIGTIKLRVLHTPGHTPGCVCLVGDTFVLTGDTLFPGSVGRTDFPASSNEAMQNSLRKLLQLEDSLIVYPGHGNATTIGRERVHNPFLKKLT